MSEDTGRLVGGRYRLGDVLGRGGMGTVWRGEDEILGRTVAVKELRFPTSVDEDEKQRLITRTMREAKAIARIRSGSAVTVFDVVNEDDRPWIVMELVEGRSLADQLRQEGPLTPQRAAEVGLAVLDVLRAAHQEGILHRDVKPSNVLLEDGSGRVVLTDFGIAKVEGDPSVTSTGMLVGAPSYISPERARGKPPGPPADLWSLGGLLYAAVEGHPPYDKGSAISTLTAVMTEPVPPPEQAGELSEAIYGLLMKDPDKRLDVEGARALLQPVAAGAAAAGVAAAPAGDGTAVLPSVPDGAGDGEGEVPDAVRESGPSTASGDAGTKSEADGVPALGPAASGARDEPSALAQTGAAADTPTPVRGGGDPGAVTTFSTRMGRFSRRTLAVTAVAVAAVLALLVVIIVQVTGDGGGGGGAGKDAASSGAGADQGKGKDKDPPGGKKDDEKTEPSPTPSASEEKDEEKDDGPSLPDGYAKITDDRFHFSMAMPKGFERTGIAGQNSGAKYSGGGLPRIQVDFSGSPLTDAAATWRKLEPAVRGNSTGYRLIDIKKVSWRDYPTVADWQFERKEDGRRVRVLNRGFKVDESHGYAILITCESGGWDKKKCRTLRKTAFETFQPAD
ncbi:MAG: serine/threonine-protein kinase [Streptomyces sp.]